MLLLLTLYALYISLWLPMAKRLGAATELPVVVWFFAPAAACFVLAWLCSRLRRPGLERDQLQPGLLDSVFPAGHLLLLIFTVGTALFLIASAIYRWLS